jgi:hypothetical protein
MAVGEQEISIAKQQRRTTGIVPDGRKWLGQTKTTRCKENGQGQDNG